MNDWDDFRLILSLSRAGTLRAAASDLGLTHTTVSRRLAMIENARGKLFDKHPEGYRVTPLGRALVGVASNMESLTHAGARYQKALDQELSGIVTLSLPEPVAQYLLLQDIFDLHEAFPQIDLTIEASSRFADLDRLEADIVVRGTKEPPDHLVGRRLFPNCVTYYAHRDYLVNTPREKLRWIAPTSDGMWPDWREASPYPDAPVALMIDDIVTRYQALANGLGLGRAACFMADPVPELVRLADDPPVPQQEFWVLTHPDLRETPRIRAVMEFITRAMKDKEDLVMGRLA
ncbi:MAG: LysR family transcriptional regulator [Erythrobacter sp.]|uniref:LysR family transcriptional regulator n=1 Tax=Erythrobacter sp. TaxID=1042 RepID=UPI00326442A4